jgi:5-formyltetrahydrofolate cyclo-ligase
VTDSTTQAKQSLRTAFSAYRDRLGPGHARRLAAQAAAHLATLEPFRSARRVALYLAKGSEVCTSALSLKAEAQGTLTCFPRVTAAGQPLDFHDVASTLELRPGPFGLREPDPARGPAVPLSDVDLFVVPGLAFDDRGGRLGWGKGHYDRTLQLADRLRDEQRRPHPICFGLAYDFQVVDRVPMGSADRFMDLVVTEVGAYRCDGQRDGVQPPRPRRSA